MTLPSFFIFFSTFDEPKVGLVILVNLIFWHEIRFMFLAVHLSSRSRQGRPTLEGRYAYLKTTTILLFIKTISKDIMIHYQQSEFGREI